MDSRKITKISNWKLASKLCCVTCGLDSPIKNKGKIIIHAKLGHHHIGACCTTHFQRNNYKFHRIYSHLFNHPKENTGNYIAIYLITNYTKIIAPQQVFYIRMYSVIKTNKSSNEYNFRSG